jgi:hypothetical protein
VEQYVGVAVALGVFVVRDGNAPQPQRTTGYKAMRVMSNTNSDALRG